MMKDFIKLRLKSFQLVQYNIISITLNDNSTYTADISSFQKVYCYPKDLTEWEKAFIGEFKADIQWPCGFDTHIEPRPGELQDPTVHLSLPQVLGAMLCDR